MFDKTVGAIKTSTHIDSYSFTIHARGGESIRLNFSDLPDLEYAIKSMRKRIEKKCSKDKYAMENIRVP